MNLFPNVVGFEKDRAVEMLVQAGAVVIIEETQTVKNKKLLDGIDRIVRQSVQSEESRSVLLTVAGFRQMNA